MNVVIWARVSSREQREGYSIDAQLRADREKAAREGWNVVREFVVAESAKRGAERKAFNEMFQWLRSNARRDKIDAILSHKLDRVCRNMRDAVRLQELEDDRGIRLTFVENEFAPGPAGALSFNVMAAVAQYYSDNLRTEVIKGIDERARQGWPHGLAAFGYRNVPEDRDEPYQPDPDRASTVVRIFELYASGRYTFQSLTRKLHEEGHTFRKSAPRFHRTALSYILKNRIYVGEIRRGETYHPGRHRPLVDYATFNACQNLLTGRSRRSAAKKQEFPLAGGLFTCAFCGCLITGERIRRKLKDGGVRVHEYYRCANNNPEPDHPKVRWRGEDLEAEILRELSSFQLPTAEIVAWFRKALEAAFEDRRSIQDERKKGRTDRRADVGAMQERLLNAFLSGTIDEATFNDRQLRMRDEVVEIEEALSSEHEIRPSDVKAALAVFDFSQQSVQIWRRSKMPLKRQILESLSLNRTLSDVSLDCAKRKPFDILAERPLVQSSRDDRRLTFLNDPSGGELLRRLLSVRIEFSASEFYEESN